MKRKKWFSVLAVAGSGISCALAMRRHDKKRLQHQRTRAEKNEAIVLMFNQWLTVRQEGKSLASYFKRNGYGEIAVYGMSHAGERVIGELTNSGVGVKYIIDQRADAQCEGVAHYFPEDDLPEVDAVVVTAIHSYDDIYRKLREKISAPILSLEDIVYDV